MSKDVFAFEVNQKSFEQYVLLNSHKIPVFVEFMGVWSGPCVAMDNIFTGLAKEFAEQFIFAKVDADEQPDLIKEYKIENLPTLMVFTDGKLVRTEVGELKEDEARQLLKDFDIYHESDLMREQAREKHLAGDSTAAIIQLSDAIKLDPSNSRVVLDMVQVFIDIDEIEQAQSLFDRLPGSLKETEMGKAINGQLTFASLAADVDDIATLQSRLVSNSNDSDARFGLSIRQITQHQYQDAVDNLFYIQTHDKEFKDGAAKEMIITISKMLTPVNDELAQEIKRKLANLLSA
ncbi:MAG: tetratricopeptide repeat protein [Gammaproteobacteria bacterium]|nr:tetratricopeptide repeat protein [Gammaproteobacteria bacterium]